MGTTLEMGITLGFDLLYLNFTTMTKKRTCSSGGLEEDEEVETWQDDWYNGRKGVGV